MHKGSLLLVDDDRQVLYAMADWLRTQGYQVDTAAGRAEALAAVDRRNYEVALVDIRLGDGDGFEVLQHCRQHRPSTTVIMITGYGTVESAIEAIRAGAFDFLTKPLIDEELEMAIQRAIDQRKVLEENKHLKAQLDLRYGIANIVGTDHRMVRVFDMLQAVADTKATVLITGESGTGKSLIARAIHRASSRRNKPFVEVACGALPETLLESELFGHVEGSFTGATSDKIGKFELAHGGTIFLDEINTASPGLQVKLLRAIQEREFERVGGTETITLDVRFILATNFDLRASVEDGTFRKDLFYRVNVVPIHMPPLRERVGDIPLLAEHFLHLYAKQNRKNVATISPDAMMRLKQYAWPGNVRELENAIETAVVLCHGEAIAPEDLPSSITSTGESCALPLKDALVAAEREIIEKALKLNNGRRQPTAAMLGIDRTTLFKKMRIHGLLGDEAPVSAEQG